MPPTAPPRLRILLALILTPLTTTTPAQDHSPTSTPATHSATPTRLRLADLTDGRQWDVRPPTTPDSSPVVTESTTADADRRWSTIHLAARAQAASRFADTLRQCLAAADAPDGLASRTHRDLAASPDPLSQLSPAPAPTAALFLPDAAPAVLIDLRTPAAPRATTLGDKPITAHAWSPTGDRLALAHAGGAVTIYDPATAQPVASHHVPHTICHLAFDPTGRTLHYVSETRRPNRSPAGLFAAGAGHPVHHSDFALGTIDLASPDRPGAPPTPFLRNVHVRYPVWRVEFPH